MTRNSVAACMNWDLPNVPADTDFDQTVNDLRPKQTTHQDSVIKPPSPMLKNNGKLLNETAQNSQTTSSMCQKLTLFSQMSDNHKSSMQNVPDREFNRGHLVFNASFESGNLANVDQISDCEYNLYIRGDTNNEKYRVWIYFSVTNARSNQRVLFNVMNYTKGTLAFRKGLAAPVVRSSSQPKWHRIPERQVQHTSENGASFSFWYLFDDTKAVYEFALSFPYTYTKLQRYLTTLRRRQLPFIQHTCLGVTLGGRRLDMLIIGDINFSDKSDIILLTARVHPGEAAASHVCQGFIDFLVSSHPSAVALRQKFTFHIVPMLNPDGVAYGNYRCSSMGLDLNRCWDINDPQLQPRTIAAVKRHLLNLTATQKNCTLYLDIHAHSQRPGAFMYGNSATEGRRLRHELLLPTLLAQTANDFSLELTQLNMDAQKAGTGPSNLIRVYPSLKKEKTFRNRGMSLSGDYVSFWAIICSATAIFVILSCISLAPVCCFSLVATSSGRYRNFDWIPDFCSCLAAGIFISACFVGILPHIEMDKCERSTSGLTQRSLYPGGTPENGSPPPVHPQANTGPSVELCIMSGFLLVLFLQQTVTAIAALRLRGNKHRSGVISQFGCLGVPPGACALHHNIGGEVFDLGLLVSMSAHSLLEGMALGLQLEMSTYWQLLVAIMLHEVLCVWAYGLTAAQHAAQSTFRAICCCILLSGMIPIGMICGRLMPMFSVLMESKHLLEALSAGAIIYVAVHMLFEQFGHDVQMTLQRRAAKLFAVFIGAAALAVVKGFISV